MSTAVQYNLVKVPFGEQTCRICQIYVLFKTFVLQRTSTKIVGDAIKAGADPCQWMPITEPLCRVCYKLRRQPVKCEILVCLKERVTFTFLTFITRTSVYASPKVWKNRSSKSRQAFFSRKVSRFFANTKPRSEVTFGYSYMPISAVSGEHSFM